MTITCIAISVLVLGIALAIILSVFKPYACWPYAVAALLLTIAGGTLLINLIAYIPSDKNSQIEYAQLEQERKTLVAMLGTDRDVDRLLLNDRVIAYNNKVIKTIVQSSRPICGEYYSDKVDWESLQTIEWK